MRWSSPTGRSLTARRSIGRGRAGTTASHSWSPPMVGRCVLLAWASSDKDESDAELAVLAAVERGATRITVVGAFGGPRLDHGLANAGLMAHPALEGRDVRLLDVGARVRLILARPDDRPAEARLDGRAGDLVTLLPFGGRARGITTAGLHYPLTDDTLVAGPARGLSNVRLADHAAVRIRDGALLIVEVPVDRSGAMLAR